MWLTPPSPCSTPFSNVHLPSRSESPATTRFSVAVSSTFEVALAGATFQSLKDFASRMVTQPFWLFVALVDWPVAGEATEDVIDLTAWGFTSFAQVLSLATDDDTDTPITLEGGDTLTLLGVVVEDLHADDFLLN